MKAMKRSRAKLLTLYVVNSFRVPVLSDKW